MSQANVDLVKSLYEAFGRRDVAAVFRMIDPSIEVHQTELLPWGGHYQGSQGMQTFFAKLLGHVDSQLAVDKFLDAGDDVVMIGRTHGKTRANETPFDVSAVHIWTIGDGKIVGFHPYIDTPAMLQALAA